MGPGVGLLRHFGRIGTSKRAVVATCVIGDAEFLPHSPARLIAKANTRTVMVRQLKVPIGFGADLPYGRWPDGNAP